MLGALKRLGVKLALDDFGTGYSSLGYLSRFPFDRIKLDRSFVSALSTQPSALAITDTVIRLGDALGMQVVAEGVEHIEELAVLASRGCDEVQGYLLGRPTPIRDLRRELSPEVLQTLDENDSAAARAVRDLRRTAEAMRDTSVNRRTTIDAACSPESPIHLRRQMRRQP
jgi:Amt family ammonium transporter